jgi:hypothetical protein
MKLIIVQFSSYCSYHSAGMEKYKVKCDLEDGAIEDAHVYVDISSEGFTLQQRCLLFNSDQYQVCLLDNTVNARLSGTRWFGTFNNPVSILLKFYSSPLIFLQVQHLISLFF